MQTQATSPLHSLAQSEPCKTDGTPLSTQRESRLSELSPNPSETKALKVEWEAPGQECEICGRENLTPEELARYERAGLTVY